MSGKVKIILAFCLSILVLILISIYAYRNTRDYKSASDWVNHTQQVISQAQKILSDVQDIETAQRGYVITGEGKYLEPYDHGLNSAENIYVTLRNLVKDNPPQQVLLDSIHNTINLKIVFAKKVISSRQKKGFAAAQELVTTDIGEDLMTKTRSLIRIFINNENRLLSIRLERTNQNFSLSINIIVESVILTILIILTTMYFFIQDHDKRMRSEKKVIESELLLTKFLESMPVGIFILDNNGKTYYVNSKSQEILGKGIVPDALPEDLSKLYKVYMAATENIYPTNKLPIVRALNGEKNICVEDLEILRDNIRVPLRVNATAITNSENQIEYAIAVFEDVTDIKEAEKKLIEAKRLAEESIILKETFLANMSHEIRTPMNAIIGFTDLLLKKDLQAQEKAHMKIIKNSGESLLRIINDILDVSKIDSGMMAFEEHPISIKEIFGSLNTMLSQAAKEKKIELSFEYDAGLPDIVLGDPTRLTQIILNLVGNAIKFTKKGNVEVFAKLLKEEKGIFQIEFSIKDTGIGLAEDKLQHIFERFRQAESHTTRNYGGTGLGLSIAKQLVELQGGSITVSSMLGVGSIFSFILPFKKTDKLYSNHHKHYDELDIEELSKLTILVVEDNPINIEFVLSLFADYNIKSSIAENGKQAIEKIKKNKYDIILMDIEMPEMNGYETTTVIRNELKNNIPIIAMTAHAMAGEKEKCLQLGMDDYISKPIKGELLLEKMLIAVSSEIKDKNKSDQRDKIIDLSFLVKSMRGKKEVISNTIDIFLNQVPEDIAIINEAVAKRDYLTIEKFSHRMKSTVSLMGVSSMEVILQEMETLGAAKNDIEKIQILNHSLNKLSEQAMQEMQIEKLKYKQ